MQRTIKTRADSRETLVAGILWLLFATWLVMLGFGVWHSYRDAIPAIGYWEAALVVVGARLAAIGVSRNP